MKHFLQKRKLTIFGAGGGPKAPPPPIITLYPAVLTPPLLGDTNQITSFSYAEMIDLISDGPIEGLVNKDGNKVYDENIFEGIYLNDVAVKETSKINTEKISISTIKEKIKELWATDDANNIKIIPNNSFLYKGITDQNFKAIGDDRFPNGVNIRSYHPDISLYQFVKQTSEKFDLISTVERAFNSAPSSEERLFLTIVEIPRMVVELDSGAFDESEGGVNSPFPFTLSATNLGNYIYFSIDGGSLNQFNYFEMPKTFIWNNTKTPAGKNTILKNKIGFSSKNNKIYYKYEFLNIKIFIWSIYSSQYGIKKISYILDKYFNNIYINQSSASLYNYNLVQSEFKNGSEFQLPFENFKNIQIEVDYNKELVGPYKTINYVSGLNDARYGFGVSRIKNICSAASQGFVDLTNETSDDIRYIKKWPVEYAANGTPTLASDVCFNYAIFDETSSSRSEQKAIPITHYITNQNVEEIYVTINVQALNDTNHIDLVSAGSIGTKPTQTSDVYDGSKTYNQLLNPQDLVYGAKVTGYLLVVGQAYNNGYVIGGGRNLNSIYENISQVVNTSSNLYLKATSTENGFRTIYENINSYLSNNGKYILTSDSPLLGYTIPNATDDILTTSFKINDFLGSDFLEKKLKNQKADGNLYYCFGLLDTESIVYQNESTSWTQSNSLNTSFSGITGYTNPTQSLAITTTIVPISSKSSTLPIFQLAETKYPDILTLNTFDKMFVVGYEYYSIKQENLTDRNIIATKINNFIDWGSIYRYYNSIKNEIQDSGLKISSSEYPNIKKYIVDVLDQTVRKVGVFSINPPITYYYWSPNSLPELFAIGFHKKYFDQQTDIWSSSEKKYFKLSFLENLIEDHVLKSNFNLSSGTEIVNLTVSKALENTIQNYEGGKLLGNSSIYSFSYLYKKNANVEVFAENDFGYKIYNTNIVFLLNSNQNYNYDSTDDLDIIITYKLYLNADLAIRNSLNDKAIAFTIGTSATKDTKVPNVKQAITAGTRLPSVVSLEIETGYEKDEKNEYLSAEQYFKHRFDIYGIASDQALIDIGKKEYRFLKSQKFPTALGGSSAKIEKITTRKKIFFYKLTRYSDGSVAQQSFFVSDKKNKISVFTTNSLNDYNESLFVKDPLVKDFHIRALKTTKNFGLRYRSSHYINPVGQPTAIQRENFIKSFNVHDDTLKSFAETLTKSQFDSFIVDNKLNLNNSIDFLKQKGFLKIFEYPIVDEVLSQSADSAINNNFSQYNGVDTFRYSALNFSNFAGADNPNGIEPEYIDVEIYSFYFDAYEIYEENLNLQKNEIYSPTPTFVIYFEYARQGHSELISFFKNKSEIFYTTEIFENEPIKNNLNAGLYLDGQRHVLRLFLRKIDDLSSPTNDLFDEKSDFSSARKYYEEAWGFGFGEYKEKIYFIYGANNFEPPATINSGFNTVFQSRKNMLGKFFSSKDTTAYPFYYPSLDLTSKKNELIEFFNKIRPLNSDKIVDVDALIDKIQKIAVTEQISLGNRQSVFDSNLQKVVDSINLTSEIFKTAAFTIPYTNVSKYSSIQYDTSDLTLNIKFWTLYNKEQESVSVIFNTFTAANKYVELTDSLPIEYIELSQFLEEKKPTHNFYINKNQSLFYTNNKVIRYGYNNLNTVVHGENSGTQNVNSRYTRGTTAFKHGPGILRNGWEFEGLKYNLIFKNNVEADSSSKKDKKIKIITRAKGLGESVVDCALLALKDASLLGGNALRRDLFAADNKQSPKTFVAWNSHSYAYRNTTRWSPPKDGIILGKLLNNSEYNLIANELSGSPTKTANIWDTTWKMWSTKIGDVIQPSTSVGSPSYRTYYFGSIYKPYEKYVTRLGARDNSSEIPPSQTLEISYYELTLSDSFKNVFTYSSDLGAQILLPPPKIKQNGDVVRRYVKVTRLSHETLSPLISKKISLQKITEVIPQNFSYPFSAMIGSKIDSRAFSQIPNRTFDCKLKKVLVPSNYFIEDGETGADVRYLRGGSDFIYVGDWDGTFKLAWTNNPAWIIMDLLVNKRYGLGNYIESDQVDIWELYKISRWCDGVDDEGKYFGVSDGFGGIEPRYTFNGVIDEKFNVFEIINQIASIFRGSVYYMNSLITFDDDRPKPPAGEFTNADVKDGLFNYTNLRKDEEYTALDIAFIDSKNGYKPSIEYIEDSEAIRKKGVLKKEINAFGITSRAQAKRFGKHILYHTAKEKLNVTFTTDMKALLFRPGDIIQIHDELLSTYRNYGKVLKIQDVDADKFKITIDQALNSGIYNFNEISLHTPVVKPRKEDMLALFEKNPMKLKVTDGSIFKNFIYSYLTGLHNLAPNDSSYIKRNYQIVYDWSKPGAPQGPQQPYPIQTVNFSEEYSCKGIDATTIKSIINANNNGIFTKSISVDEIGFGAYLEVSPFILYKENSSRYTGEISFKYKTIEKISPAPLPAYIISHGGSGRHYKENVVTDKLVVSLNYDSSTLRQNSLLGYWTFNFGTSLIDSSLNFDSTEINSRNSYGSYFFDVFNDANTEKFSGTLNGKDVFYTKNFVPKVGLFEDFEILNLTKISYQNIIENNRPTIETFSIFSYETGSFKVNLSNATSDIPSEYTEIILNKTGLNGNKKESVMFGLDNLMVGSSYSLNLIDKERFLFKISSITENYINEYNILATQYSEDKYAEIEENISYDKLENTFNALYYYDSSNKSFDSENNLQSPIINNVSRFNKQDGGFGLVIDWQMTNSFIQNVKYKIYIKTPSKQTRNIEIQTDFTSYNSALGFFRYYWNGMGSTSSEVGTYTVYIMSTLKDGELNKISVENSRSVTILDY
jgi:hypothetical protein